ncbi:MAG: methyltransferase domain-containing protein [archaeon]|nr:methyltransferase domain-containing protein [archaeon]
MSSAKPEAEGFSNVDSSQDQRHFVDYLDLVRSRKGVREGKELSFALLQLKPGDLALDVGCGTGDDVILLAKIVGEKGRAIGIDSSEVMISEAKKRAAKSSNTLNAEFHLGSVYQLDFPDETFNGVIADRVFLHLEEPRKALGEIIRVAKKDGKGRIVTHDPDWDSLVIDSEFKEVTRKIVKTASDWLKNGTAGRRMYGMFKEAGLADVTVNGGAVIFTDYEPSFQHLELEKASKAAVAKGVISEQEQERWVADLQRKGEQGRFLASFTTFRVAGTRM